MVGESAMFRLYCPQSLPCPGPSKIQLFGHQGARVNCAHYQSVTSQIPAPSYIPAHRSHSPSAEKTQGFSSASTGSSVA